MKLVVGCPVRMRDWIMPSWFNHVEKASEQAGVEPTYAFVVDRTDPTLEVIQAWKTKRQVEVSFCDETEAPDVSVPWNQERFHHLTAVRNQLLGLVRDLKPEYFLSLDSDILLHPQVLTELLQSSSRFDAVGGATYMWPRGEQFPNCGWVKGASGFIRRPMEHRGVIPVGVIMAIKLLGPKAYNIDYEVHAQGEDIGYCVACVRAGITLGWDNRHFSKHVMSREALERVDDRYGY